MPIPDLYTKKYIQKRFLDENQKIKEALYSDKSKISELTEEEMNDALLYTIIEKEETDGGACYQYARYLYLEKQNFKESNDYFFHSIKLSSLYKKAATYEQIANNYWALNDIWQAIFYFQCAINICRKDDYYYLADLYEHLSDLKKNCSLTNIHFMLGAAEDKIKSKVYRKLFNEDLNLIIIPDDLRYSNIDNNAIQNSKNKSRQEENVTEGSQKLIQFQFSYYQKKSILISLSSIADNDNQSYIRQEQFLRKVISQFGSDSPIEVIEQLISGEMYQMDESRFEIVYKDLNSLNEVQKVWYMKMVFEMLNVKGRELNDEYILAQKCFERMGITQERYVNLFSDAKTVLIL